MIASATNPPSTMHVRETGRRFEMVSSVGSLSGLSAADIQSLFGAIGANASSSSSSSSSSNPTTTGAAQSASTPVAAASPNDPINAIKSILAQAQVGGGSGANIGSIATAEAAYTAQMVTSGSPVDSSALSASLNLTPALTISSLGLVQKVAAKVSQVNNLIQEMNTVVGDFTGGNAAGAQMSSQRLGIPSGLPQPTDIPQALNQLTKSSNASVATLAKSILDTGFLSGQPFSPTEVQAAGAEGGALLGVNEVLNGAIFDVAEQLTRGLVSIPGDAAAGSRILASEQNGRTTLITQDFVNNAITGPNGKLITQTNTNTLALVVTQNAVSFAVSA